MQIEHRSVCNLVRAEGRIYRVRPSDRVYQGFSVAFDASVEEIWMALSAGATLVAGTSSMVRSGPALARLLTEAHVTVLSCVPTLLSMIEDDMPTLRLLIVGGETCPADLVRRWARPGRRMLNTYGPTEATVIATYTDCDPQRPVTIGRPLPNYRVYILDPQMQPAPPGVAGELHIGGVGIARGYVGRPGLTAERFVANPFERQPPFDRLYKTGDLARYTPAGDIEFLGRIDSQVKLRGFRIELAEIESVVMECPEVQSAAVNVWRDAAGIEQLVGYVVARPQATIDEQQIKSRIRARLPSYMVPAMLETVEQLPVLASSGKVDRKRLPPPRTRLGKTAVGARAPRDACQERIARVWETLFSREEVGLDEDFFTDLGGHSLLAATMVSQLRQERRFQDLSVPDVYNFPTVRQLCGEIARRAGAAPAEHSPASSRGRANRLSHFLCGAAQFVSLYAIVGFFALHWLTPYLAYCWMLDYHYALVTACAASLAILLGLYPLMLLATVAVKWLVIGRFKAGRYPLWGPYFFRWWFVTRIQAAVPIDYLAGTPLLNWYYRLMGARIGARVFFGTDSVAAFDLLRVGDDSSIGLDANLLGYTVENGMLHLAPITVGRRCYVGPRATLGPGAVMDDEARLGHLSLLPAAGHIPRGQSWGGAPARPLPPEVDRERGQVQFACRPAGCSTQIGPDLFSGSSRPWRRFTFGAMHAVGVLLLPAAYLLAIFPGLMLLNCAGRWYPRFDYLAAFPAALSFIVLLSLEIVAVKWLLLGRVKPGRYPLESFFYLRKWFVDQLLDMSLDLLGPMYATLYLNPWYRLLGAKLGRNAEVSTACSTSPDLLDIGDESFIADCVSLGVPRFERGTITIEPTRVGKRAFVGNSAVIPSGAVIGDGTLIGVLSTLPLTAPGAERPATSWLGSPAIFLPQRQTSTAFAEQSTFRPSRKLYALRLVFEFFRVTLPATFFVTLTCLLITTVINIHVDVDLGWVILLFPVLYAGCGLLAAIAVIAAKWILMGRYRRAEKPLWSAFVWRTELLTALHENFANPFLMEMLVGTPFICWFFRLLGAKIGARVFLNTTQLTEFDLVRIGDDAMLNQDCTVLTHLFEDRVMKMSTIDVGAGCSVGADAVVLYDSRMEPGAALGEMSLLMKGESLPTGTRWEGSPARPAAVPLRGKSPRWSGEDAAQVARAA